VLCQWNIAAILSKLFLKIRKIRKIRTVPRPEFMVSCQLPLYMAEEIAFENGQISNFEGLITFEFDFGSGHTA